MATLIVAMPGDGQVHAVQWAIRQLGQECDVFYPLDLADGAEWNWISGAASLEIQYQGRNQTLDLDGYKSVWFRRCPRVFHMSRLADDVERSVAEAELSMLASSVYERLHQQSFCVNSLASTRASSLKPYQFEVAQRVGFKLPKTYIGNSRKSIEDLFAEFAGSVIYKPFRPAIWPVNGGYTIVPTSMLTEEIITTADFEASPGIFQECIDKRVEVRATIMGRSVFAWEKSFDRTDLDVDWRFMFRDAKQDFHQLPDKILESCFALMDALDLVFGCFDLVIDKNGDYYFLEVNPQGQWLWGDQYSDRINQLDAMAQFLIEADKNFEYRESGHISVADYNKSDGKNYAIEEKIEHFGDFSTHHYNSISLKATEEIKITSDRFAELKALTAGHVKVDVKRQPSIV